MINCPECGNKLVLPDYARCNMESYHKSLNIKTDCCGKVVRATPHTIFTAQKTDKTVDDWGDESVQEV